MRDKEKEDNRHLNREKSKAQRLMILFGCIMCVTAFMLGGVTVFGISGKYNLRNKTASYAAKTGNDLQAVMAMLDENNSWQEEWVKTDGRTYRYNDDILTFLFIGIDRENKTEPSEGNMEREKADVLFLLVLDSHEEMVKLIPINRSTMTKVGIYDEQGLREDTVTAQICTQYGYGDGGKLSCDYQADAVSSLFHGIPINGYLAVDMEVVSEVVELIDGTDLELLENVWNGQQEQYLAEMIMKVRKKMKKDPALLVRIYNEVSDRAVTDITTDEVVYLAMTAGGYHFDSGQVITVPGGSVSGKSNEDSVNNEFYVDEKALYELVLNVFYEAIEQDGS